MTVQKEVPIGIKGAKEITRLSAWSIYTKSAKGEIPSYKKGGKIFFFASELVEWVRSGRRKTTIEINTAVDAAITSHF